MQFSPSGLQRHHTSKTVSKTLFPLASRKLFGVATLSDSLQSHRSAVTCLPLSILRHSHRVNETMTIIKQECTRGTTVRPTVSLNLLWMHLNIYRPHEKSLWCNLIPENCGTHAWKFTWTNCQHPRGCTRSVSIHDSWFSRRIRHDKKGSWKRHPQELKATWCTKFSDYSVIAFTVLQHRATGRRVTSLK